MDTDKMGALRAELAAAKAEEAAAQADAVALRAKIAAAKRELAAMEERMAAIAGSPWEREGQIADARLRIIAAEDAIAFESLPHAVMVRGDPLRVSRVTPARIYVVSVPGSRETVVKRDSDDRGWGSQLDIPATIAAYEAHVAAGGGQ